MEFLFAHSGLAIGLLGAGLAACIDFKKVKDYCLQTSKKLVTNYYIFSGKIDAFFALKPSPTTSKYNILYVKIQTAQQPV